MLNKDKDSRKKKSSRQEEIVKRTKKSSTSRGSVAQKGKSSNTKKANRVSSKTTKEVSKKSASDGSKKKKKVKKIKKELTPAQIKRRNILIAILTIIIIGGLCAIAVIGYKKQNLAKNKVQQGQQQILDGFTDEQLITAANAYIGNVDYNFKSVLSKSKDKSGDLVATLMATQEENGTYNTTKVNVTYENNSGVPLAINEQSAGQETQTQNVIENSTQMQNKLDVTYKVLGYLKSTGMNINDTSWAMDIYENRTVDGQTGYLIDVFQVQNGVSNLIRWIFVTNNGQMYNAGPKGTGPLSPLG